MWSVCLRITDSQHPQGHWAWNRVWAAHQWQQQQSGKVIRQLRQRKDLTAGALLREILVKRQGHDQGHLGGELTHQKGGERKGVFRQLIALVIVLEIVGNVHDPKVPMKKRRRGGLDHVLSPELGLLHQLCHQANHPHTKILCIQIVSLLWRAGNPARNAPGEFLRKKMAKSLQRLCLQCRVKSLRILWPKWGRCLQLPKTFKLVPPETCWSDHQEIM